jgi:Kef-type K+ transport system membrane component KefB/nucleotide-binding universal stress UspA family protein
MPCPRMIVIGSVALPGLIVLTTGALAVTEATTAPSEPLFVAQIVLLLVVGRTLGELMQRLGQPAIMGQLLAGILLGPSMLGAALPELQHGIFPTASGQKIMLDAVAQLGILLLLLLTGMETDLALVGRLRRAAASVSIAGISVPFGCGLLLGEFLPEALQPRPELRLITALFLGTALSISSVKIVAAVVRDMNFMRRTIGQLIVASAIIDDTIGWIIIAVIFGLALHGQVEIVPLGVSVAGTILFLVLSLTLGQQAVSAMIRWTNDNFVTELPVITAIVVIMGAMALITHLIGVHTVLGAFVAGILVGRSPILTQHVRDQLRGPIVALFMPVFFGIAGLSADLTVLGDPELLLIAGGLILIASLGKFGGAFLGGALAGLSRRECFALGCGMNARGSTEVIVATIGLSMGALSQTLYTMIVAMAFVTTMAMPPMLRWALARLPVSTEEADRLAREEIESKGFIGNLERLLVAVDHSANGRFAARLGGIVSAWRRIPTTVLELGSPPPATFAASAATVVQDAAETATAVTEAPATKADVTTRGRRAIGGEAIVTEARKGYGLLVIGLDRMTRTDGGFDDDLTELVEGFDGPLGLVEARGANLNDPIASGLDILVPVSGTQESHRALEVALVLARAGIVPLTLILAVPADTASRPRGLAAHLRPVDEEVLRQAVSLAEHYQIETRTIVRHDTPVEVAILDQLRRGRHDLVVLGVRARTGETLFFGEVARLVMAQSRASVMLISG